MGLRLVIFFTICFTIFTTTSCQITNILSSPNIVQASKLEDVRYNKALITPHLFAPIPTEQNLIWCSTFELAWNKLASDINSSIDMQEMPTNADILNDSTAKTTDVSEVDYLIQTGKISQNVLGLLNYNLKKKFPDSNAEYKPDIYIPESFVLYTYFFKDIEFKENFELISPQMKFQTPAGEVTVNSFGINKNSDKSASKKLWQQVSVDYYEKDQFIVSINPKNSDDEIIFAMINLEESLHEMIETAEDFRNPKEFKNTLHLNQLQIPLMGFEFQHFYKELQHKYFTNSGYEDYFISKAAQQVKFLMNKNGAYIDPITAENVKPYANLHAESKIKADLIFNKPFLMYVKKKSNDESNFEPQPYFAVYFNNAEFFYIQN